MSKVRSVLSVFVAIDPSDPYIKAALLELPHERQQGFTLFAIHGSFARTPRLGQTGRRRAERSVRGNRGQAPPSPSIRSEKAKGAAL